MQQKFNKEYAKIIFHFLKEVSWLSSYCNFSNNSLKKQKQFLTNFIVQHVVHFILQF